MRAARRPQRLLRELPICAAAEAVGIGDAVGVRREERIVRGLALAQVDERHALDGHLRAMDAVVGLVGALEVGDVRVCRQPHPQLDVGGVRKRGEVPADGVMH